MRKIDTVQWSITNRCNYRCKHCFLMCDSNGLELDLKKIEYIISELVLNNIKKVLLTGGEPLMRLDLEKIIDSLLVNNIDIPIIYTNGKFISDAFLEKLAIKGIKPTICISFDGVNNWHSWLRNNDNADEDVRCAFETCRRKNFMTIAEMCIHKNNANFIRDTIMQLKEWGCTYLKITPIVEMGRWKEEYKKLTLTIEEAYEIFYGYIPYYYLDNKPLNISLGSFFMGNVNGKALIPFVRKCDNIKNEKICEYARNRIYISAEGRVMPCISFAGIKYGNSFPLIFDKGLKKCYEEGPLSDFNNSTVYNIYKKNQKCYNCNYFNVCLGGCRAIAMYHHVNDFYGEDDYSCVFFKNGWKEKVERLIEKYDKI